ncbi:MAG: hypothetical protein HY220_01845 [Candidatus Sungbacteria bacterium]|uniref:Uncharacterized protein n=1 Tax=Candidatus Sungiibacteriota bacterium TaxID=2750080 RepID=A0A9D6LR09_9BACT|nr:hypothetical protein [Candidatus Sungbacteria bacterium]
MKIALILVLLAALVSFGAWIILQSQPSETPVMAREPVLETPPKTPAEIDFGYPPFGRDHAASSTEIKNQIDTALQELKSLYQQKYAASTSPAQ